MLHSYYTSSSRDSQPYYSDRNTIGRHDEYEFPYLVIKALHI